MFILGLGSQRRGREVLLGVWLFGLAVVNRIYNFASELNGFRTCPKQGMLLRAVT